MVHVVLLPTLRNRDNDPHNYSKIGCKFDGNGKLTGKIDTTWHTKPASEVGL